MDDGGEENFDRTLRPKLLNDYIGQEKTVEQLKIFIQATKNEKSLSTMYYFWTAWYW